MADQLETCGLDNKDSFNDATPSDQNWSKIEGKLGSTPNRVVPMMWKVAAVIFMISTVYLVADRFNTIQEGPVYSEEFTQAEDYYVGLISQKRLEIREQLSPEQQKEFLVEIDQLDLMYDELKKTYTTNASNDRVMDAMISNLQLRLDILNKQLDILKNIKNQNNEKDNSIEI